MTLDVEKHREALLRAFNEVVSDKKPTDWVLYGYEGQTNVLKLVGTGEDGLEELAEDLNSSKIMYAVVKVIDPNTTRPKIVLINWQGEGAPTIRKGTCARHLHDIHKLLRGVHVTVNARTEEEVEPDVVMAAVLKASATTYNFNERSEMNDKTTPVKGLVDTFRKGEVTGAAGTNYKRTNPLAEINSKSRNKFWEEQEEEEKRRKLEEQKLKEEELKKLEVERKQREISETRHRDNLTRERNARITEERRAEDVAFQRMASREDKKWEQEVECHHREEEERSKRAEQMRLERKREAEALIGKRTHTTRDRFEFGAGIQQKQESQITPVDRNRPPPRRLKEFKPVNDQREESGDMVASGGGAPGRGVMARWPPAAADPPHHHNQYSTPHLHLRDERMASGASTKVRTPIQDVIPAPSSPPAPPSKQQQQQPLSSVAPVQANGDGGSHLYETSALDAFSLGGGGGGGTRQQTTTQNGTTHHAKTTVSTATAAATSSVNSTAMDDHYYQSSVQNNSATTTTTAIPNADNANDTPAIGMLYEVDGVEYQILPEHGLCARALYDYQAADDTEITFDPSEIITNIDQIDEGWWQGVGPDGMYGLFPANYVELINQAPA